MSLYRFFTSNLPLPEVNNEKILYLSVQDAVSMGINVPDSLLKSDAYKLDNSKVFLFCDKEEDLHEIEIHPISRNAFTDQFTQMPYLATLTGKVNEGSVDKLAQYILKQTAEPSAILELWHVWEGEDCEVKAIMVHKEDQVVTALRDYLFEQRYSGAICLKFNSTEGA